MFRSGQHFVQIPGQRIFRSAFCARWTVRSSIIEVRILPQCTLEILPAMQKLVRTKDANVVLYPSSGTGAWEAAVANVLSPGDRVLVAETGQFSNLWADLARRLGIDVELIPGDWRHGADPDEIARRLGEDREKRIAAVMVAHNETSTGVTSRLADVRAAIDRASHPALFLVDTVSSLASIDYRHDEWGVDVMVCGSQKGLMLPPGIGINVVSRKALEASKRSTFSESVFRLGADHRSQCARLLSVHTADADVLRAARSAAHAARRGSGKYVRASRAPRRSDAARGRRLGARDSRARSARVLEHIDRGPRAGRRRRRIKRAL